MSRPSKKRAAERRRRQRDARREARGAASCWHVAVVPHGDHPWGFTHTLAILDGDGRSMRTWTGRRAAFAARLEDMLRGVRASRGEPHEVYASDPVAANAARNLFDDRVHWRPTDAVVTAWADSLRDAGELADDPSPLALKVAAGEHEIVRAMDRLDITEAWSVLPDDLAFTIDLDSVEMPHTTWSLYGFEGLGADVIGYNSYATWLWAREGMGTHGNPGAGPSGLVAWVGSAEDATAGTLHDLSVLGWDTDKAIPGCARMVGDGTFAPIDDTADSLCLAAALDVLATIASEFEVIVDLDASDQVVEIQTLSFGVARVTVHGTPREILEATRARLRGGVNAKLANLRDALGLTSGGASTPMLPAYSPAESMARQMRESIQAAHDEDWTPPPRWWHNALVLGTLVCVPRSELAEAVDAGTPVEGELPDTETIPLIVLRSTAADARTGWRQLDRLARVGWWGETPNTGVDALAAIDPAGVWHGLVEFDPWADTTPAFFDAVAAAGDQVAIAWIGGGVQRGRGLAPGDFAGLAVRPLVCPDGPMGDPVDRLGDADARRSFGAVQREPDATHYQFEVTLEDVESFRVFTLPMTATFADLHDAIQAAFDWDNCHMWSFDTDAPTRRVLADTGHDAPNRRGDQVPLRAYFGDGDAAARCVYTYDFGDNWRHHVWLDACVARPGTERELEQVVGATPPEDCGSIPGYEALLDAFDTPPKKRDADQRERIEWVGDWTPEPPTLEALKARFDR